MSRVLKRPPGGWGREPNHTLADWLMLVLLLFGGACFFNWAGAAFGMVMAAIGVS